ncbi:MAG TPA: FG-GAP-like repeat-containing protein [Puia sp.]|nr:FG-GAP-like repeat-containing protein [Puia sp.]
MILFYPKTASLIRIFLLPLFILLGANVFGQPMISSFSPSRGPVGSTVTITGSHFSPTAGTNVVYFGSSKAQVVGATATTLSVVVPTGASYQPISVTTAGFTGNSRLAFDVTFSGGAASFGADSFSMPKMQGVTGTPLNALIADCNGDGLPEAVVPVPSATGLYVYQNGTSGGNFFFNSVRSLPTANGSAAFGDLNGDSLLDLVAGESAAGVIDIYQNTSVTGGTVNFSLVNGITVSTSAVPASVTVMDLDLDGRPDLIVAMTDTTLVILRNTTASPASSISFAAPLTFTVPTGNKTVTTGDLDGDGRPDIILTNQAGNTISLFRNTSVAGTISLATRQDLTSGNSPRQAAVGDLDNDGRPDLAVVNWTDKSLILFHNLSTAGSIVLRGDSVYSTGAWGPMGVAIGDIDGDGLPDVAVATTAPTLNMTQTYPLMLYKNGGGSGATHLLPGVAVPGGYSNYSIGLADMNGDGRPDLVSIDAAGRTLNVQLNAIGTVAPPLVDTPHILSFTPASGTTGTVVTIKGQQLSHTVNVLFGLYPATGFTVVSDSVLTATVGGGDVNHHFVYLTYAGGGRDSLGGFSFIPPAGPLRVKSFSPASGRKGDTIQIHGQTFTTAQEVYFGGVQAQSYTIVSDSVIYAVVGSGASGRVKVAGSYGVDSLAGFTFIDSSGTPVTPPDSTGPPPVTPPDSTGSPAPGFQLLRFTVAGVGANPVLQWQTANDQRIVYYVVEHAFDSTHFSVIGTVASFRLAAATYTFMDSVARTGTNYYRLTMVDTAGHAVNSTIVGISVPGVPPTLTGYPNPAVGSIYVPVPASTVTSTITVSDMSGHVVRTIVVAASAGYVRVDLHGLNKGVYKVVWSNGVTAAYQTVLVWN